MEYRNTKGRFISGTPWAFKKGHKVPQEWKDIASKVHKGKVIPEEMRIRISNTKLGVKKSEETKQRMRKPKSFEHRMKMGMRGDKNPMWKGGITEMCERIRNSFQYKNWRSCVYKIYNFTCQKCKQYSGKYRLQAHHLKEFNLILKENNIRSVEDAELCYELWDAKNGIIFCVSCHRLFHKIYGRKNTNEIQVKEFIR